MIKEIIFKKTDDFSHPDFSIKLSKKINVIIGPKGGGKSTLFDLIAGLKHNYISDNVVEALKNYDLKFVKAIKYNNEEIIFEHLTKKKSKDKEEDYENRYDVIYQDDNIKKNLNKIKEIDDAKIKYLKKQINNSNSIKKIISNLENIHKYSNSLINLNENKNVDINWSNTFKMDQIKDTNEFNLIMKINYKEMNIKKEIEQQKNKFNDLKDSIEQLNKKIEKFESSNPEIIKEQYFNDDLKQMLIKSRDENYKIIDLLIKRINKLERIKNLTFIFEKSYKRTIDKIKANNDSSVLLKEYQKKAREHFIEISKNTFNLIKEFEKWKSEEIYLNIENDLNQDTPLIYKINENIKLNYDIKDEILKEFLYSPKSGTKEKVWNWIKSSMKKPPTEFEEDKIKDKLVKNLKDEVKVLVNIDNQQKDYESLSLGQRSIYGLRYKFNKSKFDNLYLDQPEDNLDNNTIAEEILDLIKQKDKNQVVIVTHNANIGILSKPEVIIIANLNDKEKPYKVFDVKEEINKNSAYYLEGGLEFLEQRYNKIIKEQKG